MKLSVFTDVISYDFHQALAIARSLGFGFVDIRSKLNGDSVDSISDVDMVNLAQVVRTEGLGVACVASWGFNPMHGRYEPFSQSHRTESNTIFDKLLDVAEAFDSPHIRIYSVKRPDNFEAWDRQSRRKIHQQNADFLVRYAEKAAMRGKTIVVENEPPTVTATANELVTLIQLTAHPALKVNWDIVNGWRAGEIPQTSVCELIREHVAQLHVKGAKAVPGNPSRFQSFAIPGSDDLDHRSLLGAILSSRPDIPITIDPHYGQFAVEDKLSDDPDAEITVVRLSRKYLMGLFG